MYMGKENGAELSAPIDMFEGITAIRRYSHLIDLCGFIDDPRKAKARENVYRREALKRGVEIVKLVEKDDDKREELDQTLTWLRGRDYEMHRFVTGVLDQAQAVRNATRDMSRMTGKPE